MIETKDVKMIITRGKKILNVTVRALNEPSEDAILNCRRTVTRIMNSKIHN